VPISSPHRQAGKGAEASPLAVVVVDGGARAGFGHVGRCLALWEELGGRAVFAVEDGDVVRVLRAIGAPVRAADGSTPVAVIDRAAPTGAAEVARRQAAGQRVCLIDDPGSGRSVADLVVDPPTGVSWPPTGGRRLAGFPHVLLRREVREAAGQGSRGVSAGRATAGRATAGMATAGGATAGMATAATPQNIDARLGAVAAREHADVLLSLGGSDPEGFTPTLAYALRSAGVAVVSVVGPGYRGPLPPGRILENTDEWPCVLAQARLLVGRFGHTLLEAAYLGTPALALAMDEQAMLEATAFAMHGTSEAMRMAGSHDGPRVAAHALHLSADPARLAALAERGRKLVDGLGAARVATAVRELA
jgi:hypothetical protein